MSQPQDAWTTVPLKNRRKPRPSPSIPKDFSFQTSSSSSKDTTPPATLHEAYTKKRDSFRQTSCHKTLFQTLSHLKSISGDAESAESQPWNFLTAICLATGSFSTSDLTNSKRSLWQLVIFLEIVSFLQESNSPPSPSSPDNPKIKIYAQEPRYTLADHAFLQRLEIEVLTPPQSIEPDEGAASSSSLVVGGGGGEEGRGRGGLGPAGRPEILNQSAFLYEPFMAMNMEQLERVLEADPGLYIGSTMMGKKENLGVTDEGGGRRSDRGSLIAKFGKGRKMYYFPTFDLDPNVFEGMGIFGKDEAGEDERGEEGEERGGTRKGKEGGKDRKKKGRRRRRN